MLLFHHHFFFDTTMYKLQATFRCFSCIRIPVSRARFEFRARDHWPISFPSQAQVRLKWLEQLAVAGLTFLGNRLLAGGPGGVFLDRCLRLRVCVCGFCFFAGAPKGWCSLWFSFKTIKKGVPSENRHVPSKLHTQSSERFSWASGWSVSYVGKSDLSGTPARVFWQGRTE